MDKYIKLKHFHDNNVFILNTRYFIGADDFRGTVTYEDGTKETEIGSRVYYSTGSSSSSVLSEYTTEEIYAMLNGTYVEPEEELEETEKEESYFKERGTYDDANNQK